MVWLWFRMFDPLPYLGKQDAKEGGGGIVGEGTVQYWCFIKICPVRFIPAEH